MVEACSTCILQQKAPFLESEIEKGRIFTKPEEVSAWWKEREVERIVIR